MINSKLRDRWKHLPDYVARSMVYSALRTMRKSGGGAFTTKEVYEIVADVMEIPLEKCNISTWDKTQCRTLLFRLLVRGLIYDPKL